MASLSISEGVSCIFSAEPCLLSAQTKELRKHEPVSRAATTTEQPGVAGLSICESVARMSICESVSNERCPVAPHTITQVLHRP